MMSYPLISDLANRFYQCENQRWFDGPLFIGLKKLSMGHKFLMGHFEFDDVERVAASVHRLPTDFRPRLPIDLNCEN